MCSFVVLFKGFLFVFDCFKDGCYNEFGVCLYIKRQIWRVNGFWCVLKCFIMCVCLKYRFKLDLGVFCKIVFMAFDVLKCVLIDCWCVF